MKIITVESLNKLINKHGYDNFMKDLMKALSRDFKNWDKFTKMPRPCMHVIGGVMELMPICDNEKYYTFKFVNCHPKNPSIGKLTVVATGQLCEIASGYPLMFTEMTVLTALRTAATAALATDYLARKDSKVLAIIGNGAQSEFQVKAMQIVRNIKEVRYFDIDQNAMNKFKDNLKGNSFKLVACKSAEEAVTGADIITVCIAAKMHANIVKADWVKNGTHINGLGGDTVGKTELEESLVKKSKIFVEYFEQSFVEGEIQRLSEKDARKLVKAELNELVSGKKKGRVNDREITLFDSVGIALEDYSILRLVYELSEKYKIGQDLNMLPNIKDPKNLISSIQDIPLILNFAKGV
jgi:ornithine cyclodeaminase